MTAAPAFMIHVLTDRLKSRRRRPSPARIARWPPSRGASGKRFRSPTWRLMTATRKTSRSHPSRAASPEAWAMPSGPIIVFGESCAVRSRFRMSRVCSVMSQAQRQAATNAPPGPNFLTTSLGAIPMRGPAPESFGVTESVRTSPSRQISTSRGLPAAAPTRGRMSLKEPIGFVPDLEDRVVRLEARALRGLTLDHLADADERVDADGAHPFRGCALRDDLDLALLASSAQADRVLPAGADEDLVVRFLPVRDRLALDGQDLVARPDPRRLRG